MSTIPSSLFVQFIQQGIEKGLLKSVTKTLNEQQYLHHDYIDETISKSVESAGRTTVEELATSFRLEQADVAKAIERALQVQHNWIVIDDLILTKTYVQKIKEKIVEQIADKGYVSVLAQAQEDKLPYTLIKSLIDSLKSEQYMRYSQLEDLVFTSDYIEATKSAIVDTLSAIDEPTAINKIQKEKQNVPEELYYLLIEQLIKLERPALGTLRGKRNRALFEPKDYRERQLLLIKSVFDSNKCIGYSSIEKLYPFAAPADLLKENYDDEAFLLLSSCVLKAEVKDRVKAAILSTNTYCDINELLPADLTQEDTSNFLDVIMGEIRTGNNGKDKQNELLLLDNGYSITLDYVEQLVYKSRPYLRDLTRTVRQRTHKQQKQDLRLKNTDIVTALKNAGCPSSIAESLIPHIRKQMVDYYNELLKTPYLETKEITSEDDWVNRHKALAMKKLINLRQCIYYNYLALPIFKDDTSSQKSLEKYILKSQCTDFLFHFVIYSVLSQSYNKKEVADSLSLCIKPENIEKGDITDSKQQKSVISLFMKADDHKYDKTKITKIEEIIFKKKDLKQFIVNILDRDEEHLFDEYEILGSEENKRVVGKIIQNQLISQLQQIDSVSASTAPQLLHLVSLIIFQHNYQTPLYVSGKFVPAILKVVTEGDSLLHCDAEDRQLLNTAHAAIIDSNVDSHVECFDNLRRRAMTYK